MIGLHQRAPLHLFQYFATYWMFKDPKGPPFHCDTVQKIYFFCLFRKFFKIAKGPLHFFHKLQQTGGSKNPKDPLLTVLKFLRFLSPNMVPILVLLVLLI